MKICHCHVTSQAMRKSMAGSGGSSLACFMQRLSGRGREGAKQID